MLELREDVAQVFYERDRRKGGGQGKLVGRHVVWARVGVDVGARRGGSQDQRCRSHACLRCEEKRSGRQSFEAALVNAVSNALRLLLRYSSCRSEDSRRSANCQKKIASCTASAAARHGQLHRVMQTHSAHPPQATEERSLLVQRAQERSGHQSHVRANDVFCERCLRESLAVAGAKMIATPDVESHSNN